MPEHNLTIFVVIQYCFESQLMLINRDKDCNLNLKHNNRQAIYSHDFNPFIPIGISHSY